MAESYRWGGRWAIRKLLHRRSAPVPDTSRTALALCFQQGRWSSASERILPAGNLDANGGFTDERIWKPQNGRAVGHLNDGVLDASLAKAVKAIGQSAVAQAPFYDIGAWRYYYLPKGAALPELSKQDLPTAVQQALATDGVSGAADALGTETFCSILRNGLAHGESSTSTNTGRRQKGRQLRGSASSVPSRKSRQSWVSTSYRSRYKIIARFLESELDGLKALRQSRCRRTFNVRLSQASSSPSDFLQAILTSDNARPAEEPAFRFEPQNRREWKRNESQVQGSR